MKVIPDIADARCAEKWWNDYKIKKRFARWGGGTGRYIAEAGHALLWYIGKADYYNIELVAYALKRSAEELKDLSIWAYNDIPSPLEPWVGALLLTGVPPEAIKEKFVDWRNINTPEAKANRMCLSWGQPH